MGKANHNDDSADPLLNFKLKACYILANIRVTFSTASGPNYIIHIVKNHRSKLKHIQELQIFSEFNELILLTL